MTAGFLVARPTPSAKNDALLSSMKTLHSVFECLAAAAVMADDREPGAMQKVRISLRQSSSMISLDQKLFQPAVSIENY